MRCVDGEGSWRRAWLRASAPFPLCCSFQSTGTSAGTGGCSQPAAGDGVSSPDTRALSFSFCLSSSCSTSSDFAPGNASTKPEALHGHRPCLHISFHVPRALPSVPNPSICRSLAGRERPGRLSGLCTRSCWGLRFWGGKGLR